MSEMTKLPLFCDVDTNCPFIQNLFSNLSSILAWSFSGMVLMMNCEHTYLMELLLRSFSIYRKVNLVHF